MKTIDGKKYNTKEDLQGSFFGMEKYRPGHPSAKNLFIRMTSGTTGGAPTMILSRITYKRTLHNYYNENFSKPFLMFNPQNHFSLLREQLFFNHGPKSDRILFLGKRDIENPSVYSLVADFHPRIIRAHVSLFNFFVDKLFIRKEFNLLTDVQKVYLAGEMLSESLFDKFKKVLPKSDIKSEYSSIEAHLIGLSCKFLPDKHKRDKFLVYHPIKTGFVKIIQPDESGIGEISIKTRELAYYLTGDAGKIIKERCKCGASETIFLYGRINYDIVHCVGATFHASEIERVFSLLGDLVKDYYLEIKEVFGEGKTLGSLTISVVPTKKLQAMKEGGAFVREFIKNNLQLTKTRCLGELVGAGIFMPPNVLLVPSLPASGKKIRMRKVYS